MAIALFAVKATITPDREKAFNEWYNHEHIPDLFRFKGIVSARRYKAIMGEDKFQYLALYEFESEETLQAFLLQPRRVRFTARVALAPGPAKPRPRSQLGVRP